MKNGHSLQDLTLFWNVLSVPYNTVYQTSLCLQIMYFYNTITGVSFLKEFCHDKRSH